MRHIGLKVLAIALATLLWLTVAGEQIVERALRVPLEFTNVPPDLELVSDAPPGVDIRIRGSAGALSRVVPGELVALLDLRGARPGPRLFHLNHADVRTPFGVQVVQVSPSSLWLTLERSEWKTVPIIPEVDGDPVAGYMVGTIRVEPATVDVVGPAGALDRLTSAITEPVSVRDASGRVSEEVNVGTANPSIRLREPVRARVTVEVVPEPVEWVVSDVPIRMDDSVEGVRITPAAVTLRVRGPHTALAHEPHYFEASVVLDDLAPGQHVLPVRVVPPAAVAVVEVQPPRVRVRVP